MKVSELLRERGINTTADIDRLRGNTSRYGYLCETFGQSVADKVMRALEVMSWDLTVAR